MPEMHEILRRVRDRNGFELAYFVDIGANHGAITKRIREVFPGAHGAMIEPHEELLPCLGQIAKDWPAVTVIHGGAAGKSGMGTFHFHPTDPSRAGSTFARRNDETAKTWFSHARKVPLHSLDDLLASGRIRMPGFVKIDAEGLELDILSGATKLLGVTELFMLETTLFPSLMEHPTFAQVVAFMADKGYVVYDIPGSDCGYRAKDGALMVLDVLFCLENSKLREHPFWS